ncbi:hypothetical protein V1282_004332 [Nitrobacteraceae bacterium AZCC 2146]
MGSVAVAAGNCGPPWEFKRRITKGAYERVIPIHSHLIDQNFLDYVEKRRTVGLPLFYHPSRARGGTAANPQWQKVGERLGEWVRGSLRINGVVSNHAWRHRFKSVARHVHMHPDVESFTTGHGATDNEDERQKIGVKYGNKWVKTLSQAIEQYPCYKIAALSQPAAPHKRVRRTRALTQGATLSRFSRTRIIFSDDRNGSKARI